MALVGKLISKSIAFRRKAVQMDRDPVKQQQKTFRKLIKKAAATEFGVQFLFEQILTAKYPLALFQKLVPLYTYDKINLQWWRRMRRGDRDVCWPGRIQYFALSSGTSDAASKFIPVSKHMIRSIRKTSMRQLYTMANYDLPDQIFEREILMIGGSTTLDKKNDIWFGDMSGISAAHAMPDWFINQYFKPGYDITEIKDWNERVEAIVENAPGWNIGIICGIPNWVQIILEKIIERYHLKTIHDIWPGFEIYVHGGIFFEPYKESFKALLGKELVYAETYMASEGYFGFTESAATEGIKLVLNNGIFYEFIPFHENNFDDSGNVLPGVRTCAVGQVEEGIDYAVVISNNSGAWRYLIGDTIQFINAGRCEIKITGRTSHYLSICGEHVSVDNLITALRTVCSELNIEINEFTVLPEKEGNHFIHKWYIGCDTVIPEKTIAASLDKQLKKINDDYRTLRNTNLGKPQIEIIPLRLFYDWLNSEGKCGNQYKIPRVMKGLAAESWVKFMVEALSEEK